MLQTDLYLYQFNQIFSKIYKSKSIIFKLDIWLINILKKLPLVKILSHLPHLLL